MQAHGGFSFSLRSADYRHDLFKRHGCAVIKFGVLVCVSKQPGIYKGTRVNNHIRFSKEPCPAHGNQVHRAASCSYKMNHAYPSLFSD